MGMLVNPFWGRHITSAKDYDAATYFTASGTSLGSMPDGRKGTIAFWFRVDAGAGDRRIITSGNGSFRCRMQNGPGDHFEIFATGFGGTTLMATTSGFPPSSTWHHFAASWDLNTGPKCELYTDGADVSTGSLNATIVNYDETGSWKFGAKEDGTLLWNGCLSEFFFHDDYLDLSTAITLFRTTGGQPVNPGANGNIPFGTQPRVYLPNGDPENNLGSEGAIFSLTAGALTACSSSPSD